MSGHDSTTAIERWLPVPGYEGLYEVSDHGRIRSVDHRTVDSLGRTKTFYGQVIRPQPIGSGYPGVRLSRDGVKRTIFIHRLVLTAFAGPCPEGMEACHGDGDSSNNVLSNLRWDTRAENARDRIRHGHLPTWITPKGAAESEAVA